MSYGLWYRDRLSYLSVAFRALGIAAMLLSLLCAGGGVAGLVAGQPGEATGPMVLLLLSIPGLAYGVTVFRAGSFLASRRRLPFIRRAAWLACLFFPPGTMFGVMALATLGSEPYRQAFQENENTARGQ